VFSFVQQIEGVGFREALRRVAAYAGVSLSPVTPQQVRQYAEEAAERELIEHYRLVYGVAKEHAAHRFRRACEADPGLRQWLEEDLEFCKQLTAVIVGRMLAVSPEPVAKELAA
jgi:hypothetical protein